MEHATTGRDDAQVPSRGPWRGIRVEVDVPVHTYAGPHMCLVGQTNVWPSREVSGGRPEKCLGGETSVFAGREDSRKVRFFKYFLMVLSQIFA